MKQKTIAVIVGSLRKESFSRKLGLALSALAPESLQPSLLEIGNLPLYNQDLEEDPPAAWRLFREQLSQYDGLLFITPEYNRSVPGVLKNAIDVGSRPFGQNRWGKKPCAVISISTGAIGGFGANHHLRQSLVCLNVPVMPAPEAYIGNIESIFDAQGNLMNESTREFCAKFLRSFAAWADRHTTAA